MTPEEANLALDKLIHDSLSLAGDYRDVIMLDKPFPYHIAISLYLETALPNPLDTRPCRKASIKGFAELNAEEGFIKQIIGRREYIRGI